MDQIECIKIELHEGIDTNLVAEESKELTDDLICSICNNLCFDPVICKETQCIFCRECISRWVKKQGSNANCPICKNLFVFDILPRLIKNLLNKIKIKCLFQSKGCSSIISYEQFPNHINSCDFLSYKCKSVGCNFVDRKAEVLDHIKKCNLVKCQNCNIELIQTELKSHFLVCDMLPLTCTVCFNSNLLRKQFINHNNGICFNNMLTSYSKSSTNVKSEKTNKFLKDKDENEEKENKNLLDEIKNLKERNSLAMKEKLSLMDKLDVVLKDKSDKQAETSTLLNQITLFKNEIEQLKCDKIKISKENDFKEKSIKELTTKLEKVSLSTIKKNDNQADKCKHSKFLWHLKSIQSFCFFCGKSDFCRFKCADCFKFYCRICKPVPKQNTCPIAHPVSLAKKLNNFNCDNCFSFYQAGNYSWNDSQCDLDICGKCWPFPNSTLGNLNQDLAGSIFKLFGNFK